MAGSTGRNAGRNAGQGFNQFSSLNEQLQQAVFNFASLVSGATLFGQTVSVFREFERQLVLTNSVAGGTAEQFRQMEQAVRQFALATSTSATEAASALYFLASAGFSVEESLAAMNGVLLLSQSTLMDVAFTADVVASNIRAFGLEAADTTRLSNVFAAAITNSQATLDKIAFSMRQVAPAAAAMGASLEDVTAQLAELYNIGLRGEQAGTQLRNLYVRLARPVGTARDLMRQFNIQTVEADGSLRNLRDILIDLGRAGLSTSDLSVIFGVEGVAGGIALIEAAMSGSLDRMRESITGTNRAFELFVRQLNTFDGAMNLARNAINDFFIEIGRAGAGVIQEFVGYVRYAVVAFRELDEATRENIVRWVAYVAIATVAFTIIKSIGVSILGLVSFIARAVAAVFSLVTSTTVLVGALGATRTAIMGVMSLNFIGFIQAIGFNIMAALPRLLSFVSALGTAKAAAVATATGFGAIGLALLGVGGVIWGVVELTRRWRENREASREALQGAYDDLVRLNNLMNLADSRRRIETAQFDLQAAYNLYAGRPGSGLDLSNATISVLRNSIREERQILIDELENLRAELSTNFSDFRMPVANFRNAIREVEQNLQDVRNSIFGLLSEGGTFTEERRSQLNSLENQESQLVEELDRLRQSFDRQSDALRDPVFAAAVAARQQRMEELETLVQQADTELANALNNLTLGYNQFFDDIITERSPEARRFIREDARESVIAYLRENQNALVQGLIEAFESGETGFLQIGDVFERLRRDQTIPQQIRDGLIDLTANQINQLALNFSEVRAAARDRARELALQIARAQASATEDLETELRSIRLSENSRLISIVRDVVNEQSKGIQAAFGEINLFNRRLGIDAGEIARALNLTLDAAGLSLGEALSFTGFAEAIEEMVDAGVSYEDIFAFAETRRNEYLLLVNAILAEMLQAGAITDNVADQIRQSLEESSRNLVDAINAGIAALEAQTTVATDRFNRRNSGGRGRDPAEEAKRARRQFEDALREIESIRRQAQRAQLESGVFDIRTRVDILLELDVADIRSRYEYQIIRLQRELEDLNKRFEGQPLELNRLAEAYREIIREVEAARDAEIAYTQTFTAMVERRNRAIDMQIDQLRNLSMTVNRESQRVFLGIQAGLLQYQRDLLTTVDNVAQYSVTILDGLSDAVGRWITGQGDFLEMLRETFLNATRELITNATRRILQEFAMSLSSMMASGTAAGVSPVGAGAAQVGAGIFARIFGSIFGIPAGSGVTAAAAAPQYAGPFQEHVIAISDALNQLVQGMSQVFNDFLQNLIQLLNDFGTQFGQVLNLAMQGTQPAGAGRSLFRTLFGGLFRAFSGFYDNGGTIGRNRFGIVGERGPEIVTGPAQVIGRSDTAAILKELLTSSRQPQTVVFNVQSPNPESFRQSRAQIMADLNRMVR